MLESSKGTRAKLAGADAVLAPLCAFRLRSLLQADAAVAAGL